MSLLTKPDEALKNHLLAGLSGEGYVRLRNELRTITLPLGHVIYESGQEIDYVYFPTTSIVSLLYITENGATAEIGMVGNDGLVGTPASWVVIAPSTARSCGVLGEWSGCRPRY